MADLASASSHPEGAQVNNIADCRDIAVWTRSTSTVESPSDGDDSFGENSKCSPPPVTGNLTGASAQPVAGTSGQEGDTKMIPLPECQFIIPKDKLGGRYLCRTVRSNGKHKDVEIEVLIEPDVIDTNPNHSRKGRAMLTITVPKKDSDYSYTVSATNVCLFDPMGEVNLNEPAEAKVEKVPLHKDSVTFDVELGPGLHEKVERCKSKTLELQLKIKLHLELTYAIQHNAQPSYGSYENIEKM